jgi:hypothetical protein
VPTRPLVWMELERGVASVLVGPHDGVLTLVRARGELHARAAPPLAVVRHGPALLLVYPRHVDVASIASGKPLPGLELPPGVTWRCGRFFLGPTGWHALTVDGLRPALDRLPEINREAASVWEREGDEAPWWFDFPRDMICGGRTAIVQPGADPDAVVAVSRDGRRLLLRVEDEAHPLRLVDVGAGTSRPLTAMAAHARFRHLHLEPDVMAALDGMPQVRTRLQGLAVDAHGSLALVSRRRRVHRLYLTPDGRLMLETLAPDDARLRAWRPFEDDEAPAGWALRVARWADGSRAFLDGRGLLHLVPAKGVEVTLALADPGPLAAWTTENELVGPAYYTGVPGGDEPDLDASRRVLHRIQAFCEGIR